jgi:hypothetical protein
MGWLYIFLFGFAMNFLVGFGLKGVVFREFRPLPRAAFTALISWLFCTGAAAFGGYFLFGLLSVAAMAFGTIFLAYIVPAILHFLLLYYQFSSGWVYTDEDEAAELAAMQTSTRTNDRIASVTGGTEKN